MLSEHRRVLKDNATSSKWNCRKPGRRATKKVTWRVRRTWGAHKERHMRSTVQAGCKADENVRVEQDAPAVGPWDAAFNAHGLITEAITEASWRTTDNTCPHAHASVRGVLHIHAPASNLAAEMGQRVHRREMCTSMMHASAECLAGLKSKRPCGRGYLRTCGGCPAALAVRHDDLTGTAKDGFAPVALDLAAQGGTRPRHVHPQDEGLDPSPPEIRSMPL